MSKQPSPPPPPPPQQQPLFHHLTTLDATVTTTVHTLTTPLIPPFLLKFLEITGDGRLWFPLTILLLFHHRHNHHHHHPLFQFLLSILLGLISDIIVVGLVKFLVRRPRPAHNSHPMGPTLAVDRFSFPSGHASRVCFIAAFFDLSFHGGGSVVDPRWVGVVWVWAIGTAVSRVVFGRHYVGDVIVGCCIGSLNALFIDRLLKNNRFI